MSLDVGPAIRAAIVGDAPLAALIAAYRNSRAVFAFRPAPEDAGDPMVLIPASHSIIDADAINSERPIVMRDISIYGRRGRPGAPDDQTPVVEQIGFAIRELFHRRRFSVQQPGYSVIEITATGPIPAPVDDDATVGRLVTLTIRLRRNA